MAGRDQERLAQLVEERTAQLCQAQEMFRLVLDAIPVRVHWKDRNSVYLGCNRRFAKDAELESPEQIVGKTDFDLPWKQYAELYQARDRKVIEAGEPMLDYEQPRSTGDGRTLTLRQSKLPLRDAHGAIIGVLSLYEDITERKRAEEVLRASEARLRFALEGANDGLWDVDLPTGRIYMSPRGCEILGYGCEEFAANVEQWRQMVHPDDLPPTLAALEAHLRGGSPLFAVEQRLRTRTGEWKWILTRGKVSELAPDGQPVRMTGTHSDITSRKEAETALRESEARYRAVVDYSPDGMGVAVEDKMVYVNPAAVRLAGARTAADLVGRSVFEFIPEAYRTQVAKRRAKMLETGLPSPVIDGKLQRPDGQIIEAEWIGVPIIYGGKPAILNSFRDVTEHRRRQRALQASEARYRQLHESLMDAFIAMDFNGRLTDCNESFRRMLGYTPEESRTLTFKDITPEKWHALDAEIRQTQVRARGYSEIYEKEYRRKDGTVFPVELRVFLLRDDAGAPCGAWAIVRDITERKQAEAALRHSREQLRERAEELETIMGSAPVALWVAHDPQCNEISGNRMANSFQQPAPQANWSANVSNTYRWFRDGRQLQPEELPMQQAAMRNLEIHNTELDLLLPSGRRVSLLGSAVPFRDAQGQARGCVGAFLDNTDRKQAECLLAGEKRVLEWIAKHKPLATVLNEVCRFIEELSPGMMSSILLLDADGTRLRPIAAPNLPEEWTQAITPLPIGPGMGSCGTAAWDKEQVVVSDIASDPRWTGYPDYCALALKCGLRACWSTPILSAEGEPLGTFAMYYPEPRSPEPRDLEVLQQVTHLASVAIENHRAAEAVRRAHDQLEQRVRDRTAELVQANQRLQELDRLKSQFLATMSHELRTPLNSIIGFTGILCKGFAGPVNDEQKRQLSMVFGSAKHLLSLINDLLDLSRIEAGKIEMEREPFNFVAVVEEVVQNLTPLAGQKQLSLRADLPGPTIDMLGDRKRCYQVLLNLANNAVKFTDRGEVKITARTERDNLRVSVADTGIGIKPEQMGMLFEAFRQLDGSAKRIYEGTGLGLHLCRRLLTLMGGEIGVESQFRRGSRFTFTLPRQLPLPTATQETSHENLKRG
jgi:PAS domain S-box-containing protein